MKSSIKTENLIIRDAVFGDYEFFTKWEKDREMVKYFAIDEGRTYEQVVTEGFELRNNEYSRDMTITDKNTQEPLGRVIITRIEPHYRSLDITKIYVGGSNRGRGIGTEVLLGLLKHFFEELNLERVTLDYFTGNAKAAKLYRKLGFVNEGVARNACIKDGKYYDLNLMSMLSDEYFKIYT
ncbi:MAG: GNAT family N-acetyltransferase [Lentihominibacter sp.]